MNPEKPERADSGLESRDLGRLGLKPYQRPEKTDKTSWNSDEADKVLFERPNSVDLRPKRRQTAEEHGVKGIEGSSEARENEFGSERADLAFFGQQPRRGQ